MDFNPSVGAYEQQSIYTDPGRHAGALRRWPDDVAGLMSRVQNLLIYDVVAEPFYGVTLSPERQSDIHLRHAARILDRALEISPVPLGEERPAEARVAARCSHFGLLLASALRQRGIPARMRCGFASYFNPAHLEDHWVVEYYDRSSGSTRYADPMFDATWRRKLEIDHDPADVPRDRFLTAAQVWRACRAGEIDAAAVGIHHVGLYGLFMVAGNLVRDIAALNRAELLPWDVWGAQPKPDRPLTPAQVEYFDHLAEMLLLPDQNIEAIRVRYAHDPGLKVPDAVFNALLAERQSVDSAKPTLEHGHDR